MGIRKSIPKVDAVPKVTGSAKYVEDMIPHNALYAKVLHSTIASGMVKHMDCEEAAAMPGVEAVVTCFDVPATPYATDGHPLVLDPLHNGVADRYILSRRVRFYGDEIACVVAKDALTAQKAIERIKVEYEPFTPVFTSEAAVNGATPVNPDFPNNELARLDFHIDDDGVKWEAGDFSADDTLAGCEDMQNHRFHVPSVHAAHIEPNSCIAYMEGDKMVIITCNQNPFTTRRHIAAALELPVGKVKLIKPYMGGGFGNKQDTLYEPIAAFMSRKLGGRPVALIMTREECFVNSRTRHSMDILTALAVDESGKIRKRAIRINSNGGAYAAHGHAVAAYAVTNYFQTYSADVLQIGRSSTAYTNLPSAAAMRGYGIPQLAFAMESQMDDIAYARGWDPIVFRRKNMMRNGFLDPFDKFHVESCGLDECIERGAEYMDWENRRKEYAAFNKISRDVKKGLGMAIFSYKTGVYPLQIENGSCRIVLHEDGSALIQTGATDLGQGSDTVFAQIASEILTIPETKLTIASMQDTDLTPYDAGAYASRESYVSGGAVKKTALILKDKILGSAAAMLGCGVDDLELADEHIVDKKQGKRPLCSIADTAVYTLFLNDQKTQTEQLCAESTYTCFNNTFAFGASFADIEVDVPLGQIKVKRICSVHDSGTILNPQLAKGQICGGIAMGTGYALFEQLLYDEKGRMRNSNYLDYKIPTSMDMPEMVVDFVETYEPSGPFGNKALGEPPLIPQAPAIRNALLHATGVSVYKLPMSPQNLVHAFIHAGLIPKETEE